jgi:hypothetical protein
VIRGVTYSRGPLVLCLAAVGSACAMIWLRHNTAGDWMEQRRRSAELEGALIKRVAALSDCVVPHLNALHALVGRLRGQLGTEDLWARLVLLFGKDWSAEPGAKEQRTGYSTQTGTFVRLAPKAADWPRIVDVVRSAEQLPGVGIAWLEMRSSGDREHRSLDVVKIAVAINCRLPGSIP